MQEALEWINSGYYQNKDLGKTIEHMIEEHVQRDNGLSGRFIEGRYEPEWRRGI